MAGPTICSLRSARSSGVHAVARVMKERMMIADLMCWMDNGNWERHGSTISPFTDRDLLFFESKTLARAKSMKVHFTRTIVPLYAHAPDPAHAAAAAGNDRFG